MTQNFFMVSGVIAWGVAVAAIFGFITYLIVKDVPEPKGKVVDLQGTEFTETIDFSSKEEFEQRAQELRDLSRKEGR